MGGGGPIARLFEAKAESPGTAGLLQEPAAAQAEDAAAPQAAEPDAAPARPANRILRPTGTQIKQLTLTRDAIEKGVKPGERVVSEAPTKTGKLVGDRTEGRDARGRRTDLRGTPGETNAPQMTYTPPADNRRRPGRSGGRKGKAAATTTQDLSGWSSFCQALFASSEFRYVD